MKVVYLVNPKTVEPEKERLLANSQQFREDLSPEAEEYSLLAPLSGYY
jgi:hypothetical protein